MDDAGCQPADYKSGDWMSLTLVEVKDDMAPAAFHELAAARYVGTNRTQFRALVFAGAIPYATHLNGKTRIYLREDLDKYLHGLEKRRMAPRENPSTALKGVK